MTYRENVLIVSNMNIPYIRVTLWKSSLYINLESITPNRLGGEKRVAMKFCLVSRLNDRPDDVWDNWTIGKYSDGIDRVYGELSDVASRLYGNAAEYFSMRCMIVRNLEDRRSINSKLAAMHPSKAFVCKAGVVAEIDGIESMSIISKSLLLEKIRPDITLIKLKVGMPIILTKDCTHSQAGEAMVAMKKGSRLVVVAVKESMITAKMITPGRVGMELKIGRTMLYCDDVNNQDYAYLKHQFPVVLGYANAEGRWNIVAGAGSVRVEGTLAAGWRVWTGPMDAVGAGDVVARGGKMVAIGRLRRRSRVVL
ncbi:hypothetical protein PTTG_29490 [Puccinia triticina 1-1 BBBD Race 1]|uniref:Uncharacterized protein n=1 Tax=Puccinia triticina (isolate 1-1 / race 1 (BBBD)) TaxID=630390 RepID=A0A180G3S1_PUCT1|nr:hypothetical protein PTTG_29490 [Puccinia triticina 1-1 BBBD Race 1]